MTANGTAVTLDARGPDRRLVTVAAIDGRANPDKIELIAGALSNARLLLELVDRATRRARQSAVGSRGSRAAVMGRKRATSANCSDVRFWTAKVLCSTTVGAQSGRARGEQIGAPQPEGAGLHCLLIPKLNRRWLGRITV
ncbi:MAG: hypothetical protein K5872_01475 [Rhizobiaceae bacterium]|nr:hypothetical protein [Rhizobiaceae bacterium]